MKIIRLKGPDYTEYMKNVDNRRHKLKKSLWDEFGEVRITNPSGRFIGIVRQDPGEAPDVSVEAEGETVTDDVMEAEASSIKRMRNSGHVTKAPSPKSCKCADWPWASGGPSRDEKGKPTEHHPKCAYKGLYERQKGHKVKAVASSQTMEPTIHKAGKVTNTAINRGRLQGKPASADRLKEKVEKIPMPENCPKCKDFTKSKKMEQDQHHPTCVHFKKYKAISHARASIGKPIVKTERAVKLMDLDTLSVVRDAEPDEIAEGRRRLRDEGTAFAEVDGEHYLCMYEDGTTLEPAETEPEKPSAVSDQRSAEGDTEPPSADVETTGEEQASA